jgi:hypothetical protein
MPKKRPMPLVPETTVPCQASAHGENADAWRYIVVVEATIAYYRRVTDAPHGGMEHAFAALMLADAAEQLMHQMRSVAKMAGPVPWEVREKLEAFVQQDMQAYTQLADETLEEDTDSSDRLPIVNFPWGHKHS